jgi:4-amino-4-deoxy-L-arabinose transferase-like glycosyltransferase
MKRRAIDVGVLTALIAITSWFLDGLALKTYDFFDMSAFMDAGYRVYLGQSPYVDFFYNAGPVHLYLHAFFFTLFGFTKTAVLAHLFTVNAVVVASAYVIARKDLSFPVAAGLALLVCLSHYALIAHPWYDQNAGAFLVAALLIFELTYPKAARQWRFLAALACGCLVSLSFFTKSNVGSAGAGVFLVAFVIASCSSRDWVPLTGYLMGAAAATLAVLLTLESPESFYFQTFIAYDTGDRLRNWRGLIGHLITHQYIMPTLVAIALAGLAGRAFLWRNLLQFHFLAGFLAISLFTAWTGSMLNNSGLLGIVLLYLFVLVARFPGSDPGTPERRALLTLRGLNWVLAALLCFIWYSQKGSAWHWRGSNMDTRYALTAPGFEGWNCSRGIGPGLDEAVTYIIEHVPREETLFVFPDATVAYGLTGRPSYRKAPFIFHVEVVPPPGKPYDEFREHFLREPPQWILLHYQDEVWFFQTSRLLNWLELDGFLQTHYQKLQQWGDFALFRLVHSPNKVVRG